MVTSWTLRQRTGVAGGDILNDWAGTLIERYNLPDTLQVTGWTADLQALLVPGGGCTLEDDDGIRFSGPLTELTVNGDGTSTATFASDLIWLFSRLCYPNPALAWASQDRDYDTRSGVVETVTLAFINANAGPGALAARQVPGLTLPASVGRGGSVNITARFDVVGQLVKDMAETAGLRFRVLQSGSSLALSVISTADLSSFAKYGSADVGGPGVLSEEWAYTQRRPGGNVALVAGGGEGALRILRERADSTSVATWGRIETFVDQRNTSSAASAWEKYLEAKADAVKKRDAYDDVVDKLNEANRRADMAANQIAQAEFTLSKYPTDTTAKANRDAAQGRYSDATGDAATWTTKEGTAFTARAAANALEVSTLAAYNTALAADKADLDKAGDDENASQAEPVDIRAELPDVEGMRLGADVPVGSLVGLDLGDYYIVDRLREITTTIAPEGDTAKGVVGSSDAGLTRDQKKFLKLGKALRKVQAS